MNCLTGFIGAAQLKGIFGNINAQYANRSHVDLPSEVKFLQTESSLEDPAGLAARMGMVHYIRTLSRSPSYRHPHLYYSIVTLNAASSAGNEVDEKYFT